MARWGATLVLVALVLGSATTALAADDARSWTTTDTVLEASFVAMELADYSLTMNILRRRAEGYSETNLLLGHHPSVARVTLVGGALLVLHGATSYLLPRPYRTWWQLLTLSVAGGAVAHNLAIGLRFDVPW